MGKDRTSGHISKERNITQSPKSLITGVLERRYGFSIKNCVISYILITRKTVGK